MSARPLILAAACLAAAACSSNKPADQSPAEASASYGRMVKRRVLDFVREAKADPKRTGGDAAVLLETLEAHPNQPVGDNKPTLEQLTQKCKSLSDVAKQNPRSPEVGKLLGDMTALAKKLPD